MPSILKAGKQYTFSDYFDLNYSTRDILEALGYGYRLEALDLPRRDRTFSHLSQLRDTYTRKLPLISLTSEAAKREFYISPLLLALLEYIQSEIDVDYPVDAGENLSGTMDYWLNFAGNVVIIKAKKGDLERGFNQLAAELVALDRFLSPEQPYLYGAVTLGDVWRFGRLDRQQKTLTKDINAFTLLSDLQALLATLIGILECE